ncbi:hypothetical protein TNCV_3089831 [Trichonephila clavipes]|nr:hypothetical protein TNCV_3089831 [Trichonephila clavipes]
MSVMETEPPDITKRPHNIFCPEINDEFKAEYVRLKSNRANMTTEETSLYLALDVAFTMHKIKQEAINPNSRYARQTTQSNDKRRKQKEPKKKAVDPPPKETDNDRCRHHKEIQKDVKMMTGRLSFLEHCINSEKEFPDLTDDVTLVGYQKDYDDLASLKEHKLGELALILPCPVLDCSENKISFCNLNDPPENNAKKHSRQVSHDSKKAVNSNTNGGITSPKKVAKKLKLSDPIAGTSQPISVKNKFSSLAGKEAKVIPPISNQATAPVAAPPKIPPIMFKHKKKLQNYH